MQNCHVNMKIIAIKHDIFMLCNNSCFLMNLEQLSHCTLGDNIASLKAAEMLQIIYYEALSAPPGDQ